ncbi:MAG: indolepyruvate ferredoxin oxidoreductase family protein [Alphaproteobacteria bacterium]|nr:indolepyruvate ferredoxin oxidoreductase family protein [Alphaproteobacteria bacterium]
MDIGLGPDALTLDSRYTEYDRPILLSGIHALVRALLEQGRLDREAGHHTAGLVSGYRGSPLGGMDQELWRQEDRLKAHDIRFQPGLNEDLAATMLFGTQQIDAFPGKRYDGVFGLWYAKGPGVDRSGDALHCATMFGTAPLGGVLAVAGDDHAAQSSTYPHQTDQVFQALMMPVLAPSGVADILDFALAGIALSRFCGLWVAMKTIADVVEQHATVVVPSTRSFVVPEIALPAHGLNIDHSLQFPAQRAELERRVLEERLPAALAWVRANRVDRLVRPGTDAPVGLVTVGKAHTDAMHALAMLGLGNDPRIAVYKLGLSWPIEPEGLARFARGKRALLVIEEKRAFVETQIRDALYGMAADTRPAVAGKIGLDGSPLLTPLMEFTPDIVATGIARFLRATDIEVADPPVPAPTERPAGLLRRAPAFCAGCPHGTSTKVPEGSFATAGIGCHFLALTEDDTTRTFTHMGGEGAPWIGLAPFTDTPHVFVNMGDGTYQHSGLLAIRQAVAARARVTFKILFNDAVAMTGGQPAEGAPNVPQIAAQVAAEGVKTIAVVADEEERLPPASSLPAGATRDQRDNLDAVQRRLRGTDGVSVIIYDQVCATEKRRRRKRGTMAQPVRSVQINAEVCENCGDCSVQSSCIAIEPVETELGRKRRINPTSCNVDLSCLKGFCPSFVTVAGPPRAPSADPRWRAQEQALAAGLPDPVIPVRTSPWRGVFAGIGGGGIVTTGAIVAQAAQLDGRNVTTLDHTGLAQKNGAVIAHVQVGEPGELDVVRIPRGTADLMLAADLAVAASPGILEACRENAAVIGNLDLATPAGFKHDAWLKIDAGLHRRTVDRATPKGEPTWLHAAALADHLFGNAQAMNTLMLGLAWQRGLVPISLASLLRSIELNGAAIELNLRAFLWGRILAVHPEKTGRILADVALDRTQDLAAMIEHRAASLARYQNAAYAKDYRAKVDAVIARETELFGEPGRLSRAAAEGWFRVLGYKDEYEVARLHAEADYRGVEKPVFHLAPPLITRIDPATGRRRKIAIPGRLALPLFRILRHGKVLRGTALDLFGRQEDRRAERAMVDTYAADMREALAALSPATLDTAVALAELPDSVRGFGPVKLANWRRAQERRTALLARLHRQEPVAVAAE